MGDVIITPNWSKGPIASLIFSSTLLLLTSILPEGNNKISGTIIGGIYFSIVFANLARNNEREAPAKRVYTIFRYLVAVLLIIIIGTQLYLLFAKTSTIYLSTYTLIVYSALLAYLIAFKPSNTTIGYKLLKIIGYIFIFVAITALQKVCIETPLYYYPYAEQEINWSMFIFLCIIMAIGVSIVKIGHRTIKRAYMPDDISMLESTNRFFSNSQGTTKTNTEDKSNAINVLLKIFISLLLPTILILSMIWADHYDFEPWLFFYLPYYLFILFYYEWLIWRKKASDWNEGTEKVLTFQILPSVG